MSNPPQRSTEFAHFDIQPFLDHFGQLTMICEFVVQQFHFQKTSGTGIARFRDSQKDARVAAGFQAIVKSRSEVIAAIVAFTARLTEIGANSHFAPASTDCAA